MRVLGWVSRNHHESLSHSTQWRKPGRFFRIMVVQQEVEDCFWSERSIKKFTRLLLRTTNCSVHRTEEGIAGVWHINKWSERTDKLAFGETMRDDCYGKYRILLEAAVQFVWAVRASGYGCQCPAYEISAGKKDWHEGCWINAPSLPMWCFG